MCVKPDDENPGLAGNGRWWAGAPAVLVFFCLAVAPGAIAADVVYMKNGDRFTGEVNRVWDNEVYLETDYADEFTVALEDVERIESTEEWEIELRDHSVVTGQFVNDPESGMALLTGTGTLPLPPMAIEELDAASEAHFDWEARADVSSSVSTGNTDTADFLVQAEGQMKLGDHRDRATFRIDRKEQDGSTTKDQTDISYTHSWFFADQWFAEGGLGYTRDPIRDLSYRYIPGAGIGYQFFEDAYRLLEVSLALTGVFEKIGDDQSESVAPRWSLRYRRELLGGDMEFFHNHSVWSYLSGRDNNVIHTSTGIRWDVWGDIYMNAQFDWNWESDPAAGNEEEDVTYILGIGLELD
jgi:hypothetical protein